MIERNLCLSALRMRRFSTIADRVIAPVRRLAHTTRVHFFAEPPTPGRHKLPPPPPLARLNVKHSNASSSGTTSLPWKNTHEILAAFVEYVPSFFVPIQCVAVIMPDEIRAYFQGRGKLLNFFRRHPFLFDLRNLESGCRIDVRLQTDVSHPRYGVADQKYTMTDVGAVENYVAKPEFIVNLDSIEQSSKGVSLHPQPAPPAIRVQLEERVPVLDRLVALVPNHFESIEKVEETLPDEILFHPYFDCQGGLTSIASKFPDDFQVVDGKIRRRPAYLAPLSLNEYTLNESPIPEIASLVKREVCNTDIPRWVSITSLYELLTPEQKREVKRGFKSFAGFLRAHGKSLSVSQDMLCVAIWIPPSATPTNTAHDRSSFSAASRRTVLQGARQTSTAKTDSL